MLSFQNRGARLCDGFSRREWLRVGGLSVLGLSLSDLLAARNTFAAPPTIPRLAGGLSGAMFGRAKNVIFLWLQGGPPQLETFDPHPGTAIAAGTGAIDTAIKNIQLATGLERTAEEMGSIALVRSMVSKEGDHERASYAMKTGFRPDPTVVHPSIGAICCHELEAAGTDIPRHVSILASQ